MKYFTLILIVVFSLTAGAKEFHEVKMADDISVAGQKLFLKGMGLRELSFIGIIIRVYVGGLYSSDLKLDCPGIIQGDKTRVVYMSFLRHVSPYDLNKSLKEGIENNCGTKCKELVPRADELKSLVPAVNSGDLMKITFDSKGTAFQLNDKVMGRVEGVDFSKTLLSAFIGQHPATEDLKAGMCGLKD